MVPWDTIANGLSHNNEVIHQAVEDYFSLSPSSDDEGLVDARVNASELFGTLTRKEAARPLAEQTDTAGILEQSDVAHAATKQDLTEVLGHDELVLTASSSSNSYSEGG
jgi:hypothetical protein